MKIQLSGAQGVGKTTLINLMREDPYFKNFSFNVFKVSKIECMTSHVLDERVGRLQFYFEQFCGAFIIVFLLLFVCV